MVRGAEYPVLSSARWCWVVPGRTQKSTPQFAILFLRVDLRSHVTQTSRQKQMTSTQQESSLQEKSASTFGRSPELASPWAKQTSQPTTVLEWIEGSPRFAFARWTQRRQRLHHTTTKQRAMVMAGARWCGSGAENGMLALLPLSSAFCRFPRAVSAV